MAQVAIDVGGVAGLVNVFEDESGFFGCGHGSGSVFQAVANLFVGFDGFKELIADHADGSRATSRKALDKFDGVFAIGAVHWAVGVALCVGFFAKFFVELVGAGEGAREGAANADVCTAKLFESEHRVKGDKLVDVDGLEFEFGGDPLDSLLCDVAETVLPSVQEHEAGGTLGYRIAGDDGVNFCNKVGRNFDFFFRESDGGCCAHFILEFSGSTNVVTRENCGFGLCCII